MNVDINIKKFKEEFDREYRFLYENHDNVAGYEEAVKAGDEFIRRYPKFAGMFAAYRMDFLSSDREVAAFAFALEKYAS